MCKKNFKITTFIFASIMLVGGSFATFATTADTTNQKREQREFKRPENEIFGKITAINANSVTISVATIKDFERNRDGRLSTPPEIKRGNRGGNPPEKPQEGQNGERPEMPQEGQNGERPEMPNMDDMFTLTGETKTINISNAEFVSGFRPRLNGQNANDSSNATETKKTYQDFSVGDYISVETTDSTYSTAKTVREAFGGGGGRGFDDRKQKGGNNNKNNNRNK